MEDDKGYIVNDNADIVSEATMDAACTEILERNSEYAILESKALKTLARRAMQQYQNGECVSSEQAMHHFKRFIV